MPTRWTLVLRARGDSPTARAALSELCAAYYQPVLTFLRASGRAEDASRDLAQEFFAKLLAGRGLENVDPTRGKFRSFLLGAVKHFVADEHDRAQADKRGSGQRAFSLEAASGADTTALGLQVPDPATPVSDAVFDREWAQTVVARTLSALAAEFGDQDSRFQFETLKPWLLGAVECLSQADAARQLGLSEGAVKVAIHRLRKRFRVIVKSEIAHTLPTDADVEEELRYLVEVLS